MRVARFNEVVLHHAFDYQAWDVLKLPLRERYPGAAAEIMLHTWFYVVEDVEE